MTNKENILRFIGLAMRANKVVSGCDAAVSAVLEGEAKLIVFAEDISRNTMSKILDAVESSEFEAPAAYRFGESFEIGNALGKPKRAVAVITDKGFADKLQVMFEDYSENETED